MSYEVIPLFTLADRSGVSVSYGVIPLFTLADRSGASVSYGVISLFTLAEMGRLCFMELSHCLL